ncbi:MAG: type II toxin-antitoxin system RelE/ParE family toxin [Patescibacteria group bacterium]
MGKEDKYSLKYNSHFDRNLDRIDSFWQKAALKAIEDKLALYPSTFGTPLRQTLKGFRKLRIGDHRIVYRVRKDAVEILIVNTVQLYI